MGTSFCGRSILRYFSFFLLALGTLALGLAGVSEAQSNRAKAASTNTPATSVKASEKESSRKGLNLGIKVHGHWVIEVKNPDGKLVTHREFENSLLPASKGGAALLAAFLGRSLTPGSWYINLNYSYYDRNGTLIIAEPANSVASSLCSAEAGNVSPSACSTNLSLTVPTDPTNGFILGTVNLAGSVVVPTGFPSTLGYVYTSISPCIPSDSPSTCVNDYANSISSNQTLTLGVDSFTSRQLDGVNGDPPPVTVSAGQTVQVNVTLSFQ